MPGRGPMWERSIERIDFYYTVRIVSIPTLRWMLPVSGYIRAVSTWLQTVNRGIGREVEDGDSCASVGCGTEGLGCYGGCE